MDTTLQECKKCGFETDCIEGICLECRLIYERDMMMDKELIGQLANDVNNAIAVATKPYQQKINRLKKALEYAKNFIDGLGNARLKENLGRDGMDAVLKEIENISNPTDICPICCEEKSIDDLHRNCGK